MPADVVPMRRQQAAEVLRPGTIDGAVDDHVTDLPGAQVLWLGRKTQERIDLARSGKLHWPGRGACHPVDIPGRIEPRMSRHRAQEQMRARAQARNAPGLSLPLAA